MAEVRQYTVSGASTDTFGRVLCSARNHHVVVDGPEQNGCPERRSRRWRCFWRL